MSEPRPSDATAAGPGRGRPGSRVRRSLVAVAAVLLVGWFATDQLVVTPGRLARTLDRVYVVSTPDEVPGPLGLLAAAELALDTDLVMVQHDRTEDPRAEVTRYEVSDRLLGLDVSTACVRERVVDLDGRTSRSYDVEAGSCGD